MIFMSYDLKGNLFELDNYAKEKKAKYLVVDFFSIICEPCKKAMPELEKFYLKSKEKGIEVVVVAIPSQKSAGKEEKKQVKTYFSEKAKVSFPVMYDIFYSVAYQYGVAIRKKDDAEISVPQIFLLDSRGNLLKKSDNYKEILKEIEKIKK